MRRSLEALTEELHRLKAEGVKTVSLSDESLQQLRRVVQARGRAPKSETVAAGPVVKPDAPIADKAVVEEPVPLPSFQATPKKIVLAKPEEPELPPPPVISLPGGDKATQWEALRAIVLKDPVCNTHVRAGKKVVFGIGSIDAKIMFVGEAPGAEEEVQGEPFVGPAGQLLTKMILATGLKREDVYIGNIMNWRPQMPASASGVQYGNRPPTPLEMAYCLPYLKAQIEVVNPKLIVALGATAALGLLGAGTFDTLGQVRGKWHEFAGKPLMVTYHPSYILRNASNRSKRMIWEDFLKVMERVDLAISEKQRGYFLEK